MNYRNIIFAVFVVISFITGCVDEGTQSDIAFVKYFGEGKNDIGVDICEYNNNICVLSNFQVTDTSRASTCLYFLNKQGEFINKPFILDDLDEDEYGQKLLCDEANNLYIVSSVMDDGYNERILIRKLKNNSIEWSNYYGEYLNSVSASDAIILGNEIVVLGNTTSTGDLTDTYFLKINLDGELVSQYVNGGSYADDIASNIIEVDDSYYFIGYSESYNVTSSRERSIWLVNLKGTGKQTGYKSYGSEKINEGLCLKKYDNTIIFAANEKNSDDEVSGLKIYGVDLDNFLSVEWETDFVDTRNIVPVDIVFQNKGFAVISNRFPKGQKNGNICILYYDFDGDFLAKKELGANNSSNASLLQVNNSLVIDGELYLVGYNENESSDVALLKLNSSE